jgi:tRNA modification GTPase
VPAPQSIVRESQLKEMETIAAIATPVGSAGIGVIRISGPEAMAVAARVFDADIRAFPSHTAHYGTLVHPESRSEIDRVVLTLFRAPHSYTGEDTAEISCHGGQAVLRAALGAVMSAGARLAEPGEFTKRAFLNGRLDLAQAEAVNDLIRAHADASRRVALRQLEGSLSKQVRTARERVTGVLAAIEAAVDFPDDVDEPDPRWIEHELLAASETVNQLLSTYHSGRIVRDGLRVVIAGRVNVGKSSILNALLREARAIVTPIPGTTRDIIEESLQIEGIPIVAVDTAGLRATDDPVELIGIDLAEESIARADVVVMVFDISEGPKHTDGEILSKLSGKQAIVVLNKIDLLPEEARDLATEEFQRKLGRSFRFVQTCASSGQGIDQLEKAIAEIAAFDGIGTEGAVVTNARHQELLRDAAVAFEQALETVCRGEPIDLLSVDLITAHNALGRITGDTADDQLLDRIFSEFCIGK